MLDDRLAILILKVVEDLGFTVAITEPADDGQDFRVEAVNAEGERYRVEHESLYRASCELAVLVGIDLEG